MGASKRIAELVLLALGSSHTRMTAVRLCNVIGSQGSVLPLFLEQIAAGGPLTVTDPDARRYFITVHRAVECIFEAVESPLEASILAGDPGPAMRIVELAKHLIRTHASTATLTFTGLRPGDKLSESLLSSREEFRAASRAGGSLLRVVESPLPGRSAVCAGLEELQSAVQTRDMERLLRGVLALVPEYRPSAVIDAALAESGFREVTAEMHA
jgi:FlaA1/EpsC-like NDP-sugar epimerase